MKNLIPLVFAFAFFNNSIAQKIILDINPIDQGIEAIQLTNGNFVVAVSKRNFIAFNDSNIYIVNPLGEILWEAPDSINNSISSIPYKLLHSTSDGNFILCNATFEYLFIRKISPEGVVLYKKREKFRYHLGYARSHKIKEGYLSTFTNNLQNDMNDPPDAQVMAVGFSEDGNIKFTKRLIDLERGQSIDIHGVKYHEESDSYYFYWYFVENSNTASRISKRNLSKYDSDFNHLWTKTIAENPNSIGSINFEFKNPNEIIFAFPDENGRQIIRVLDLEGNEIKTFESKSYYEHYVDAIVKYGEKIYIGGGASELEGENIKFWMMGINDQEEIFMDTTWGRGGSFISHIFKETNGSDVFVMGTIGDGCTTTLFDGCQDAYLENFSENLNGFLTSNSSVTNFDGDLQIYPNPSTGFFSVNYNKNYKDILSFEIYNSSLILQEKVVGYTDKIDLSSYSNGIYFLKVRDYENNYKTYKLIKQE